LVFKFEGGIAILVPNNAVAIVKANV